MPIANPSRPFASDAFERARERMRGRRFEPKKAVAEVYGRELRKIAKAIGHLVTGMNLEDPEGLRRLEEALRRYADVLGPWAEAVAGRMIEHVARTNVQEWKAHSEAMGRTLTREMREAPTGWAYRELMAEQVGLIRSLPTEAADRVHHLVTEGLVSGRRASEIAAEIARTGEVAVSRANLIAVTEASRASATLTQARAQSIGSPGYLWRTSRDEAVRKSHRAMEGQLVRWSEPPTIDGMTGHAGCFPRCRCFPEPVLA